MRAPERPEATRRGDPESDPPRPPDDPTTEGGPAAARDVEAGSAAIWSALESVFHGAVALPAAERPAFLDRACEGNPFLRSCAASILAFDTEAAGWLRGGIERAVDAAGAEDWCGRQLGAYRLVRKLGEGGMGAVYLAERCDGEYEQRVAVKVVDSAPRRDDLRRRFLVERQILARLEHPNVSRFLGGGTTEEGIPYLLLEYVDGETITAYCARRGSSVEARLELFRQVLDAVSYAHRNLVVHRDLKPSNILVTETGGSSSAAEPPDGGAERPSPGTPTVKLLDFGIAKLLDEDGGSPLTQAWQRPMTPEYASPEQRLGLPVTTATDVYALGLVLYELLCGRRALARRPGSSEGRFAPATLRPPSQIAGDETARQLRGDLDRIVMRALAPEPAERYVSVSALDADLERFLRHEPVSAMPRAVPYLLRKFLARHRKGVAAAALVLLALGWGVLAQHREATAARAAESETRLVADYLVRLFELASPGQSQGAQEILIQVLDRATASAPGSLDASPRVRARLQHTLGKVYWNLGAYDRSAELLEQALALRTEVDGPRSGSVGATLYELGRAYQLLGRGHEAVTVHERGLAIAERAGAELDVAAALSELSVAYRHRGRFEAAERAARRAVAIRSTASNADETSLASSLNHLASVLAAQDRLIEAEPIQRRALEIRQRLLAPDHPDIATSLNSLAILHARMGDVGAARDLFRASLELRQRILPADHADLGQSHYNLANAYLDLGEPARARPHLDAAIAVWNAQPTPHPRRVGFARSLLGDLEAAAGRTEAAAGAYATALDILDRGLGADSLELVSPLRGLAEMRCRQGRMSEADELLDRALVIGRARYEPEHAELSALEAARTACRAGTADP